MHASDTFLKSDVRASSLISSSNNDEYIILFGGQGNYTFRVDVSPILMGGSSGSRLNAKVTQQSNKMNSDTNFCKDSDFHVRQFGNYLYAVDGAMHRIHVYSVKDQSWNFSSLSDLGVV